MEEFNEFGNCFDQCDDYLLNETVDCFDQCDDYLLNETVDCFDQCDNFSQFPISDDLLMTNSKRKSREIVQSKSDKKLERYKRIIERRQARRKVERERRRSKKTDSAVVFHKLDFSLQIYVDFNFPYVMSAKELRKTVSQMGRIWGLHKRYIGLQATLLAPNEAFLNESRRILKGFDRFSWNISPKNLEDCAIDRCVYLSPSAELPPLLEVKEDRIYIIGGLVDETGVGSLSKTRADSLGIKAYRLPITEYMHKGPKGTFNVMLSLNNVVEILALYTVLKDWKEVLSRLLPKRTGYFPMDNS